MNKFKIERGVEIPGSSYGGPGSNLKYRWPEMKKGDSFLVKTENPDRVQNSLCITARLWAKRNGKGRRFTTRQVDGGVRVWRIA